jgi:hypothetical protein
MPHVIRLSCETYAVKKNPKFFCIFDKKLVFRAFLAGRSANQLRQARHFAQNGMFSFAVFVGRKASSQTSSDVKLQGRKAVS